MRRRRFNRLILLAALALSWPIALLSFSQGPEASPSPAHNEEPTSEAVEIHAAATAEALALIAPVEHHVLRRPIELAEDKVHWPDRTYPYGSTQWDTRPPHLGVEFVNPRGTSVYAAEEGKVVFAGSDSAILIGPHLNYYGSVVVLVHELRTLDDLPLFTLYGHLDKIRARAGQSVESGERIGSVGSTGVAIGAHLHFEVRAGSPFDYRSTRNPELWLQYYVNHGMIAGFIHDAERDPIEGKRIVIRSQSTSREVYTYSGEAINRDPVWGENFTAGDLPAGEYEIVVLKKNGALAYRERAQVEAYQTTFIDILIDE